jgi:predicted DNA-binding transcriptional regulator AlpA
MGAMATSERLTIPIKSAAAMLGISKNLAYRLARERKLPGVIFLGSKRMVVSAAAIRQLLEGNGHPHES